MSGVVTEKREEIIPTQQISPMALQSPWPSIGQTDRSDDVSSWGGCR